MSTEIPNIFQFSWRDHFLIAQNLLDFSLIPTWGQPGKVDSHFLRATVEAGVQATAARGRLAASLRFPGPAAAPALSDRSSLRVSPGSPGPRPPPVFVPVLSEAATPLSGAPDRPAGEKKDNWGTFCLKQERTNLACFSSNTYVSQFWLMHSSKSSSLYSPS